LSFFIWKDKFMFYSCKSKLIVNLIYILVDINQ